MTQITQAILPSKTTKENNCRYGLMRLDGADKRKVLVQYYVCNSNIPSIKVIGYIKAGDPCMSKATYCGNDYNDLQIEPVPDPDRHMVRRSIINDLYTSGSGIPFVCFSSNDCRA